ncbi:Lipase 3 [Orchesella cincta]|uniref:Lipase n=1 Tax=Orchesella cincta TaxID=48709 RepID=A0A1D2MRG2_ORCCI|nr:Lipase 3 [Orchesella cincta]
MSCGLKMDSHKHSFVCIVISIVLPFLVTFSSCDDSFPVFFEFTSGYGITGDSLSPYFYGSDADLSVPQLIHKYGFPCEIHHVTTKDGYILELHRIPFGTKSGSGPKPGKDVVFLQHGFLASSADWIMNTVDKALAYELANHGYDVWLGNARGNTYSKNHTDLSPKDSKFWKFSFHEMGAYDIPAVLDYVLNTTQQPNLFYIGHSMGTCMFWITMQMYPEYNSKIRNMFALAPIAYVEHIKSPIRILSPLSTEAELVTEIFGDREFLPHDGWITLFRKIVCSHEPIREALCANIIFLLSGFDKKELNETMLPIILAHTPAGASTHTIIHFAQYINSGKFRQFDYGKRENMKIYKSEEPPKYDLSKVTAPVSLYWSDNDWLAVKEDVDRLKSQLPNVNDYFRVNYTQFTHLDFLFAIDAHKMVYERILESMKKY